MSDTLNLTESSENPGEVGGAFTNTGGGGPTLDGSLPFGDATEGTHTVTATVTDVTGVAPPNGTFDDLLGVSVSLETSGGDDGAVAYEFTGAEDQFDYLTEGETVTVTYTVTVVNHESGETISEQAVTVTITGSNDAPDIVLGSSSGTLALTESSEGAGATGGGFTDTVGGGSPTLSGTLAFSDPDSSDTHTASVTAANVSGGVAPPSVGDLTALLSAAVLTDTSGGEGGVITYTFTGVEDQFDYLAAGETVQISFTVTVRDRTTGGLTDTQTVTVTITGSNDAPEIVVVAEVGDSDALAFTESSEEAGNAGDGAFSDGAGGAATVSGTLSFSDPDFTGTHTATVSSAAVTDGVGPAVADLTTLLSVEVTSDTNATGTGGVVSYEFTGGESAFDYLAEGETVEISFTVQVSDGEGEPGDPNDQHVVTVTITGSNDAPDIVVVSEIGDSTSLAITESSEAAGVTGGSFTETVGGGTILSGTLSFTDPDFSDTHFASVTDAQVTSGTGPTGIADLTALLSAVVSTDTTDGEGGVIRYSFVGAEDQFDYLGEGETLQISFTVAVHDRETGGLTDTQTVTVTITGSNDAPEIVVVAEVGDSDALAFTESSEEAGNAGDGALSDGAGGAATVSGTLSFSDPDFTGTHTATVSSATVTDGVGPAVADLTTLLSVEVTSDTNATGTGGVVSYEFTGGENAFDYLAEGETVEISFTVQVSDGEGEPGDPNDQHVVTVTITGSNDAPDIVLGSSSSGTLALTESSEGAGATGGGFTDTVGGGAATLSGTLSFSDPDFTDEHTASVVSVARSGNGPPPPAGLTLASLLSACVTTEAGADGTGGVVTYTFNNAENNFDYLAEGETAVLTYTIRVTDDATGARYDEQTVTVTITGSNDAPDIVLGGGTGTLALTESSEGPGASALGAFTNTVGGGAATLSGTLSFSDPDFTDDHAASVTGVVRSGTGPTPPGSLNLASLLTATVTTQAGADGTGGVVTYTFNNAENNFDYLAEGETAVLTYTIRVTDDATGARYDEQTVTVTITGSNDAPDIVLGGGTGTLALTESSEGPGASALGAFTNTVGGGAPTFSGTLSFSDPDFTDDHSASVVGVTRGGNGPPPPASLNLQSLMTATVTTQAGAAGTGGVLTYTFNNAENNFDYLAVGETAVLTYTIRVTDDATGARYDEQTVTVTITGRNDAPDAVNDVQFVTESATSVLTSAVAMGSVLTDDSDPDLTDHLTVTAAAAGAGGALNAALVGAPMTGQYGTLVLNSDGSYTYTYRNTDSLIGGETAVDVFKYRISDGHGGTDEARLAITVSGTDLNLTIPGSDASPFIAQRGNDIVRGRDGINDTIYGRGGHDQLLGFSGNDTLYGEAGNDILWGGDGNNPGAASGADTLYGGVGDDILHGQDGNDVLWGGNGNNSAGSGNDTLFGEAGQDTLNGEDGNDILWGGADADTLNGGDGNDELHGGDAIDTMQGGTGNDVIWGDAGDDKGWGQAGDDELHGGDGNDTLVGGLGGEAAGSGNDVIFGDAGNDQIYGEDGNDVLSGGAGLDQYSGGVGTDTLYFEGDGVSDTAWGGADQDRFVFQPGFGVDTIKDFFGVGTTGDKIDLTAFAVTYATLTIVQVGKNVEITGAGLGAGNKIILENVNRGSVDATDFIFATNGTANGETVSGTANAETLNGFGGNDTLNALGGNDLLDGGLGTDAMNGGAGDDTYIVDNTGDSIVEIAGGGTDTVLSSVTFALAGEVERLTLTGTAAINGTGNGGANIIIGNGASNVLAGLGGADKLVGGDGIDTASYAASVQGVSVSLATGLGSGGDAAGDTLSGVENLTGSSADDTLEGNAGDNTLDGGANSAGGDTASYANATSGVTVSLAAAGQQNTFGAGFDTLFGMENLTGSVFDDTLTGNTGANRLSGQAGNDALNGGDGADVLVGGIGNDTLTGGIGGDAFLFNLPNEGLDTITDFAPGSDYFQISAAGFGGTLAPNQPASLLTVADLALAAPVAGTATFIYDNSGAASGTVYFDVDGGDTSNAVAFAQVTPGTVLTASDFHIA